MSNRITYSTFTFNDSDLLSGSVHLENAMIGETLSADTLSFTLKSDAIGARYLLTNSLQYYLTSNGLRFSINDGDLTDYIYGTPCHYYHDDVLIGKFYISNIKRVGEFQFKVEAISAIGLLTSMRHYGGVYLNQSASAVINSIMSGTGISYTTDSAVGNTRISGWLPIQDKRSALQMTLFAIGASLVKNANGSLRFTFNQPTSSQTISSERIYLGGDVNEIAPATKVTVTEHLYYALSSTEEKELYYGTLAGNTTITFDEPYHSYRGSGITIVSQADNYVVISGSGTLYGKPYIHTQADKVWTASGSTSATKEYSVKDCTLVSALNSANVLNRVANYYSRVNEVSYGMVVGSEKPADLVTFLNPFKKRESGYIKSMDMTMSGTLKAQAVIDTDWTPTDVGNNFNNYQLFTSNGTFTVPSGKSLIRVVMCSGFKGGQGGSHGTAGTDASGETTCYLVQNTFMVQSGYDNPGNGGKGGKKGTGGIGFYLNTVDLNVSAGQTFSISIGAGGAGGVAVANGQTQNDGSIGGATTFGSYTSTPSGATVNVTPFINFLTGTTYGFGGNDGIDGADGAKGGQTYVSAYSQSGYSSSHFEIPAVKALNGGNTGSWQGGQGAGNDTGWINTDWWGYGGTTCAYGGGGGASYGNNGGSASTPYVHHAEISGGHGGDGASAVTKVQAQLGYCGDGASGGGGGGGGGSRCQMYGIQGHGTGGALGYGSNGQQGSNGLCIVYY